MPLRSYLKEETHLSFSPKVLTKKSLDLLKRLNKNVKRKNIKNLINHVYYEAFDVMNPYHNIHHVYEVIQVTTLLIESMPKSRLTPSEKTLIQIAALFHDYKHFGKSNNDWNEYDKSYREKGLSSHYFSTIVWIHSLEFNVRAPSTNICTFSRAISVILQYKEKLFPDLSKVYICELIRTLILSTNMAKHDSYIEEIKDRPTKINDMILIMKLADISHPLRTFHVHLYWVYKISVEIDIMVSYQDSHDQVPTTDYIAKDTLFFIHNFVKPLVEIFTYRYKKSNYLKKCLETNINLWKQMLK